jgi:hypothetical protein
MAETIQPRAAARVAFTYRDFTLYQIVRGLTIVATEMLSVAVGWQVNEITKRPLDLGLVGLAQFFREFCFSCFPAIPPTVTSGAKS